MESGNPYEAPGSPLPGPGPRRRSGSRQDASPTFLGAILGACGGCILALLHLGPRGLFWVHAGDRTRGSGVTALGALVFVGGGCIAGGIVGWLFETRHRPGERKGF